MHPKVLTLRRLMDGGFTLLALDSDGDVIHAELADHAGRSVTLDFTRADARILLFDRGAFGGTGARGGASRWRVTAPLR